MVWVVLCSCEPVKHRLDAVVTGWALCHYVFILTCFRREGGRGDGDVIATRCEGAIAGGMGLRYH